MIDFQAFKMIIGTPKKVNYNACSKYFNGLDISSLLGLVEYFKPKRFVEFGLNSGHTARMVLDYAPYIENYIGIDVLPGFKTVIENQNSEIPLRAGEMAEKDKRLCKMITKNGSIDITPEMLGSVDMAFIDADHSYEGVKRDTELVLKSMGSKGGVIVWHDYLRTHLGVRRFIDERNQNDNRVCLINGTDVCFEIIKPK
jgi:predicted O-methyltransferase YrrM